MAVTEGGEDDDQTGDSGMGTGYESAQYLMRDFLPGIVHSPAAGPTKFLSILSPVSTSLKRTLQLAVIMYVYVHHSAKTTRYIHTS